MNGRICTNCHGPGNSACKGCLLVVYCGRDCQRAHWDLHKQSCRSPLNKSTWEPQWVSEGRTPAFVGGEILQQFGGKKYFWGNVPALDVIQLPANEGVGYKKDLHLLFAASGDLRNVVKSLASLPPEYTNRTSLFINDLDFEVVARNLIIVLIALLVSNETQAVDCMLHIWYSALIRQSDVDVLVNQVRPLVEDVVRKITNKPADTVLGKTWKLKAHTCRAELTKEKWSLLLTYLEAPKGLSAEHAQRTRLAVTLAVQRKDHRERRHYAQRPAHRVCTARFFEDGLLLPFGHDRREFDVPNPTFFRTANWPMMDSADPLCGWSFPEVLKVNPGPATNDLYGQLFYYIRDVLYSFHGRLASHASDFEFSHIDAKELNSKLNNTRFARIEVANISDGAYLGMAQTMAYLGPLLQTWSANPHATLLTLFMNAVDEVSERRHDVATQKREVARALRYSPLTSRTRGRYDPRIILVTASAALFRDVDKYFDVYMKDENFKELEERSGMLPEGGLAIKERHTIIDKWPMRLKLRFGQAGAQEEFEVLQASSLTGCERYMEWKKDPTKT